MTECQVQTEPRAFSDLARELLSQLRQVSSTQLGLLREIETASAARRREIEQQCAPTVVAPRPAVGEAHGLEEAPVAPPPPRRVQGPPPAPRDPEGTVITVAGSGEEGFADGPALTARFNRPRGMAVLDDGSVLITDAFNHRILI